MVCTVNVNATAVNAYFAVDNNVICPGGGIHITNLSTNTAGLTYTWMFNGGQPYIWNGYDVPIQVVFWNIGNNNSITLQIVNDTSNVMYYYTIQITVWPEPNILQIVPQNPMLGCGNSAVNISIDATNTTTYSWKNGAGIIVDTDSISNASIAGNYIIEVKNQYGCKKNSNVYVQQHMTMSPHIHLSPNTLGVGKQPITSNLSGDTITSCQGQSYFLELFSNNFSNFSVMWEDSSTLFNHTVYSGGKYYVTLVDNSGCIETDTVFLKINPLPPAIITGNPNFCEGTNTILSLNSGIGYTYSWDNSPLVTQTISVNYTSIISGIVIDSLGCFKRANAVQTNILQKPNANITIYDCNMAVAYAVIGETYQWYYYDSVILGATSKYYTATAPGFYKVEVTNAAGCINTSAPVWAYCSSLGIPINEQGNQKIYPNPIIDNLNIEFSDNENHTIILFDVIGKEIFKTTGKNLVNIAGENLKSGIYLIDIDGKSKSKVIKK